MNGPLGVKCKFCRKMSPKHKRGCERYSTHWTVGPDGLFHCKKCSHKRKYKRTMLLHVKTKHMNSNEIKSDKIEKNSAVKRSKKLRKNTNSRFFYKSEHVELLKQTYEKSARYPSKEEMSELAQIIGVLPNKVLWWFAHRRQMELKKGDKFSKTAKNENLEKLGSTIETDAELNSNNSED